VTAAVSAVGFSAGVSNATITVSDANASNDPQTVSVTLTLTNIPSPTAVTVVADGAEMTRLDWNSDFTNVIVVYRGGAAPSATPTNGTVYSVGDLLGGGVVIRKTSSTGARNYEHVGLTNGATHYYAFYNVNENHYSTGVVLSATTASYYAWEIVEPAAYTNADNLSGLNNGKGWTNSWITTGSGTWTIRTNYSYATADVPMIPNMPLYPAAAGNVMRITLGNDEGATARRNFAGITTGTVYMAAQLAFRYDGGAGALDRYYGISFMQGGTETGFVGRAGGNDKLAIDSYGGIKAESGFQINGTEGGDTGNVYLVIAKYDFATKVISAKAYYRTTTVPGAEPTYDVTATVPGAGITRIDGIQMGGGGYSGESIGNLWFDEVRVASSWETLVQQFGPDATNYAIGTSGQVTDGALTGGTYGVVYWFRDPEGLTNSAGSPNFDLFNPAGVQIVTDQTFGTRTFADSGRELYASNGANALVASSLVSLGVYTSRWSAADSNGAWTADRNTLSNGTVVTFTVIDDDTSAPVLSSLTVGAGSGLTDGQLASGGWTFTGLVQDTESGIDASGSPGSDPYPPFYDILNPSGTEAVNNGTFDTSPSDGGGSSSAAALAETAMAAVSSANNALGTWTARVYAANNDNDRTDDRSGVTSEVTFVVSDDDSSGPVHSGFTGLGRTLAGATYTNAELGSGLVVTGLVTDATSGVWGGTSNRYTLFRGGSTIDSGGMTALFADGTAITSNGQLTVTLASGDVSTSGSYTLRVYSVNYDLDRSGDGESTTTDIEFTVVAATLDVDVLGNGVVIGDGDATPTTADWTDFADVLVDGGTLSRTYTITNSGAGSLGLGEVTTNAAGVNKADFVVTVQPSSPLAAGDITTFTVLFNPAGAGTRSSIIEFTSTVGTAKSPYTFTIQGTGTYVEVAVSGNGNNIADDDLVPTTTDGTDFGAVGVQGGVILVDFGRHDGGSNGDVTTSPDVNGNYWNNIGGTASPQTNGTRVDNMVTVDNRQTTIGVQLTSWGWGANGLANGALFSPYGPSNSLLGNFAVETATEDYLYAVLSTGQSFKVTGLDASRTYNLRFFGTRSNVTTRTTRYTVGAVSVDLDTSGPGSSYSSTNRNDHRTVMITNLTPSGSGEIDVNVMGLVNDGGSYFGYIGILEIHEVPQDARTFTITNTGNRTMTLGKVAISGTGTSDFVVVSQPSITLAPSNSTTIMIRFDPTVVGLRTAVVSFATSDDSFSDSLTENPFNFAIQGNGVAPSITNYPTTLAFESLLGSTPAAQTYSISNNALGSMLYTSQVTAGSAWLSTAPGTATVGGAAGQVHTASVAMLSGLVPGVSNGTITIASPSATNSPQTIAVTWTISAITNPTAQTATADGAEMVRLAWTKNGSHSVLIIHNSSNAPSAPVNGTGYTVGSTFADGSRVLAWSNALAAYEHVVPQGSTNFYAFYSINHNYYSPGVTAGATTATYYAWEIVEPAAYTNSNSMDSRRGGNGWTNAWSAGAWFVTNLQPTAAGLYPTSRGNSLFLPTNTAGDIYRNFPEVSTGKLYLSYVVSYGNNGAGTYGGVQLASNANGRIFIGLRGGATVMGVEESSGFSGANSAYGLSAGTNNSHTILARYDFSTREIAAKAVYRTGTVPVSEPTSWDVTFTVPSGIANALNGVRLNFGGFSGNSVGNTYVDEIRVAQSWAYLLQQFGPDATNYAIGTSGQVTDGALTGGTYGVVYWFRDPEGLTNSAGSPNFDVYNPAGVQIVTDQTFGTRTFMDGGRELYASNGANAFVLAPAVTLGVYTSRWSAHDSNGASTINSAVLSNGTAITFTVIDDDTTGPSHSGFSAVGRTLNGGSFTNNEFTGGFIVTGVVADAFSGVWGGTSNRYTLSRDGASISNGAWTAGFANGGGTTAGALSNTFEQTMMVTPGAYTLTVFSVDYDVDRDDVDGTSTTSTYSFTIVEAPAAPGISANPATLTYHVMLGVDATNNVFTVTNIGSGTLYYTNYQTYGEAATGWFVANPTNNSLVAGASRVHTGQVASSVFTNTGTFVATNRVDGNQTNAAQEVVITLVVTNIPTPTAATVTADGPEMTRLAWNSDFTNVLVVYRGGAAPSADPTNGTVYSVGDLLGGGVVIRKTSSAGARTFEHTGLTNGATHYYAFYAVNHNRYSTSAVLSATTLTFPAGIIVEQGAYTQGVDLVNGSAGQGWTNNWSVNIFGGSAGTFLIHTNATLPNFPPNPNYPTNYANRIRMEDLGTGTTSSGHAARAFAPFTTGKVYVAWRQSYQYRGAGKFAGVSFLSNTTEKAFFGEIGGADETLGIDSYGGSAVAASYTMSPYAGGGGDTGNVYTVFGSYDFSTRQLKTWSYYRTTTVPTAEPTPDAVATAAVGAISMINGVRLNAGCATAGQSVGEVYWDEIRVAGSWAGLFGYTEPVATNFLVGGDNAITDDELENGTYSVVFNFRDPAGMTNSLTRPNFDILNPSGIELATNQTFSAISYMDSGREQLASNAAQPAVPLASVALGIYTARYSAFNSNGYSIIDSATLSNGTPVAFAVIDDDFDEPIPSMHNLLVNPGFETNGAGWSTFDAAGIADTNALNGTYAGYISSASLPYGGLYQDVTGAASKVYVWSVRAKRDADYAATNTWLKMEWKDGGFGDMGAQDFSIHAGLSTNWGTFYMTATSAPGTVYARAVLINNASGGTARVYFDNAVLAEVSPMALSIGTTYYTPNGVTTNAAFTLTDADLAGVSGASPLRFSFGAYDVGNGLARGSNDVSHADERRHRLVGDRQQHELQLGGEHHLRGHPRRRRHQRVAVRGGRCGHAVHRRHEPHHGDDPRRRQRPHGRPADADQPPVRLPGGQR
jgi:hypothetical protein